MDFGEGAVDRRTWDELPTRKLMVVDSRHHHHHRSTVTSRIQVSTSVGARVLGNFTSISSLRVHSNDKVGSILKPTFSLRKQGLGGQGG